MKGYSCTAGGVLSNLVRHPESLGHTLKAPVFGRNTQFHFVQRQQVYDPGTSVIMSYFHF